MRPGTCVKRQCPGALHRVELWGYRRRNLRATVESDDTCAGGLLELGSQVEVLEPGELREELGGELKRAAQSSERRPQQGQQARPLRPGRACWRINPRRLVSG